MTSNVREITLEKSQIYEPTPDEIIAVCEAIRSNWSEDERFRRQQASPDVPEVESEHVAVKSGYDVDGDEDLFQEMHQWLCTKTNSSDAGASG